MDAHFRAFSFVDQITGWASGARVTGRYAVPAALDAFPISLVAEAIGQLAAWGAMSTLEFTHRPVAGIAGRVELLSSIQPGQVIDMSAQIESVDSEGAAYSGQAHVDGVPILRLRDCVGPMVPGEEFDDPQALRERFGLLCSTGVRPGGFGGLPPLGLEVVRGESAESTRAILHVPAEAPFFADHFPRRAVFPGTLLMHANLQTAAALAASTAGDGHPGWQPRAVSDVKLRSFIPPGAVLHLEATLIERSASLRVAVEARTEKRRIGSAVIEFEPEVPG